ncbi:hypothetical protein D3C73_1351560 [compost metagenome]
MIGGVVFCQPLFIQRFQVAVIDFRDIAEHMRQLCAIRILAIFIAVDGDAAEMKLINRETGDLHVGQRIFEHHRAIATTGFQIVAKLVNLIRGQVNNRR